MEKLLGEIKSFILKGYKGHIYSKISNKESVSLYIIHDGEIFKLVENNILSKVDENTDNIIIVAIESNNRYNDYTPWPENEKRVDQKNFGGKGDSYLEFIVKDIIPYIKGRFNIEIPSEKIFLAGASLGGLISLYGLFEYPEEFGGGILVSSSFWYDDFLDYLRKKEDINTGQKIYMDVGDREGSGKINLYRDILEITKEVYEILLLREYNKKNIEFRIKEGMTHSTSFFIDRLYDGIIYLETNL